MKLRTLCWSMALMAAGFSLAPCRAQQSYFSNWPEGTSPQEVGKRIATHFVTSPHQYGRTLHYSEVATWYGSLRFAQITGNTELRKQLISKFEPMMPGGPDEARTPLARHVDSSIFGVIPLEIGLETTDARYLSYGQGFADRQWENPRADGLSQETRFWIDDMYMLTLLQLEAFRATHEKKYLDRAAVEMAAYLDKLQQPNGLFFHSDDVPVYWGRGDGWVAAGMAEMLASMPEDHPQRARILAGYRKMMAALVPLQGRDGMWRQVLDNDRAWPETSSTAMFTFALISGVKHRWVDPAAYGPVARRAWIAAVGYVDQNDDMTSVCEGTNKLNNINYYLARKRRTGDFHGQAPMLWATNALLESSQPTGAR